MEKWRQGQNKSVVLVGTIISLSFHAVWACVSENRQCNCIVNHLHFLYFVFPCTHVFSTYTLSSNTTAVQRERLKRKQTASLSGISLYQTGLQSPSAIPFCVFILLSCSCCRIDEFLRTNSAEISAYGWKFYGKMILVVLYDLPTLQYCTPLLDCHCVCGWGRLTLVSALGEKEAWTPVFASSLQEMHCIQSVPSTAHKGKDGGYGWDGGYYCSQRSSTAPTISSITQVNTFITGLLATMVPVNLRMENAWNFLSKWVSQCSYVITCSTEISNAILSEREIYMMSNFPIFIYETDWSLSLLNVVVVRVNACPLFSSAF